MKTLTKAWGAIRSSLEQNSFYNIKNLVALAGLDVTLLSHLEQKSEKGATKGQLMTAIDAVFSKMNEQERQQFITILTEELLKKDPAIQDQLEEHLSRHGWGVIDHRLVPLDEASRDNSRSFT
ncbi:MAG: hypothetical protein LBU76_03270 [Azoarcus sp.]|jgi:hypothetical protein|nr:hypothetical protein [Azoarcus sp.]